MVYADLVTPVSKLFSQIKTIISLLRVDCLRVFDGKHYKRFVSVFEGDFGFRYYKYLQEKSSFELIVLPVFVALNRLNFSFKSS